MSVVDALKNIARSAPEGVLERIALHDSHEKPEGTEKHLRQLKFLIHECDCKLDWETMSWYPHEAIALASHNKQDIDVFAVSIALLLIFDLDVDGGEGGVEGMFGKLSEKNMERYKSLPEPYMTPILAGSELLKSRWPNDFY